MEFVEGEDKKLSCVIILGFVRCEGPREWQDFQPIEGTDPNDRNVWVLFADKVGTGELHYFVTNGEDWEYVVIQDECDIEYLFINAEYLAEDMRPHRFIAIEIVEDEQLTIKDKCFIETCVRNWVETGHRTYKVR